jgi:glycosyltransferase involved in cell wall biosynthesis
VPTAIASVFILAAGIQFAYYLFVYSRIIKAGKKGKPNESKTKEPVSIVICARNEAANLQQYLPLVLEQEYPDFEVIVVNDCSADDTEDVLLALKQKYQNLKTTIIKEDAKFSHGKKLALTVGIKAAANEWLLLTDADCYPESKHWLSGMAQHFTEKNSVVLGYGGFFQGKDFVNKLIRFDALFIALQYFTFALAGRPYMGVGRNMAYRKSVFFKNKGFASHLYIDSGDDDLFVQEIATKSNTDIELSEDTHTRTAPKKNMQQWFYQKTRHLTTSVHYRAFDRFALALEPVSRELFYITAITLLFFPGYQLLSGIVFVVRETIFLIIINKTARKLKEKGLALLSLIFDIILPFILLVFFTVGSFGPKRKWR